MEDGEARFETGIEQVGVERAELFGEKHALVDERAAGQRADVEIGDLGVAHAALDAPADEVERALEIVVADAGLVRDHDLLDLGARGVGLLADHGRVDRHLAPAEDTVAEIEDFALDDGAAGLLRGEVGLGQEDHARGDASGLGVVAGLGDLLMEEVLRDLDMDARAVAGLAVGVHRAPVPDRLERVDARFDHVAPGRAVDRGDEPDAAGSMLVGRIVEALGRKARRLAAPAGKLGGGGLGRAGGGAGHGGAHDAMARFAALMRR